MFGHHQRNMNSLLDTHTHHDPTAYEVPHHLLFLLFVLDSLLSLWLVCFLPWAEDMYWRLYPHMHGAQLLQLF